MVRPKTDAPRREAPPPAVSYRATALPSGRLLPIEVRIGRRLLRTIPVACAEGRELLRAGRVEIVSAPDVAVPEPTPGRPPRDH